MVEHHCNPSYSEGRSRIVIQGQPWQKLETFPEKNKSKRTEGVAQMVDCLASKLEALGLIPSAPQKRKKVIKAQTIHLENHKYSSYLVSGYFTWN
jgi:hypothetical protein